VEFNNRRHPAEWQTRVESPFSPAVMRRTAIRIPQIRAAPMTWHQRQLDDMTNLADIVIVEHCK